VFLGTFVEILFVTSDNFDVVDFLRLQVVCEEMEWLYFYPGSPSAKSHDEHKKVKSGVSKAEKQMALVVAVQTSSLWVRSFGRYSTWIRKPQGFRGTTFLEKG
jgi:hypothetical protein